MASVVWVWDMQKMSLEAVLEQTSTVRCFQWDPRRPRLALCTANTKLYLWSPAGCVSVQVPSEGIKHWNRSSCCQMYERFLAQLLHIGDKTSLLQIYSVNMCDHILSFLTPARWFPGPVIELALQR